MKKTKITSLLLCLALFFTLIVPGTAVYAEGEPDNGMMISKTAIANGDGSYTITLEAFATGAQTTTTISKDVPTDIILVLDQSGSMADDIGQVQYKPYTGNDTLNRSNYERRHNGGSANLWHKLNDGSYVSVSVTKTTTYKALGSLVNYEKSWGNLTEDCYYYYANNLYEKVGDEYKKVTLTEQESGSWYNRTYTYTYTFSDGTSINSTGRGSKPKLGSHAPLYTPADVYTYTYTDANGTLQTIGTSTGANTRFTPVFYQRSTTTSGGGSRLNALKKAATAFANAVATKAAGADGDINTTADNIDHRIAVVGYADTDQEYGYNTGVFIGSTLNRYETTAARVYGTALQDMSTTGGKNNVTASLNALQASGATRTDYGLTMANGILNANSVPAGETRNRVVIVFTDGSPTNSNGFQRAVANSAISTANAIKAGGTTVYSIGIFSGADASTGGKKPEEDYYDNFWESNYTDAEMSAACNWFMQQVSSNNGKPRDPSYYLSADDAGTLNSIFQKISSNITTGGSSTTLGSETVIKDIISPYFTLPAGTTASGIRIDTYDCIGKTGNTYTWSSASGGNGGATATVNGDQVSVTGFDFSENWCGTETNAQGVTTYHGKKLVISFKVDPKSGFLGGNDVITNADAGIYENSSAQTPILRFEQPKVNVPIEDVTVTAGEKNVYLLGDVTAEQLKDGAEVKVGETELKLNEPNYGLADWQTAYVNIDVTVKDKAGNTISSDGLKALKDDTTYTIEVKVSPKNEPSEGTQGEAATEKSGSDDANINVFKPELTFKDSEAKYGETVPDDFSANKVGEEKWKHNGVESGSILGEKPKLELTYTPDSTKILNGKYTNQDVPVKVTVKIGDTDVTKNTTFVHKPCNPVCGWVDPSTPGDPAFKVHITTCSLTITKTGRELIDEKQSFIFNVKGKDNNIDLDVVIAIGDNEKSGSITINDLPIGEYTVTEKTSWSWRYKPDQNGQIVNLKTTTGVTFNNSRDQKLWLNGCAYKSNIFGKNN